jgi:hypothetical protein
MIHIPAIPTIPLLWSESWTRGSAEPDRWTATRKALSGVVTHEVEFSNASFYPTIKGSAAFSCAVEVDPPRGYVLVADCDRPLPSVWWPMHAAMRRFALYPKDRPDLRPEAERAARGTYDLKKWRRGRLAYGACNTPLPDLSVNQAASEAFKVSGWLSHLRTILASTTGLTGGIEDSEDGIYIRKDGWVPWGIPDRGAPAGSGIFFYTGWEQAPDSPAYSWLKAVCCYERSWSAYDRSTGNPITVYNYGDPGPMYQAGTGDPNNGWLPEFVGVAPWPEPLPLPYDASHSIRGFRDLIFLSECMDSPAVKRMLRTVAAQFRLQYSDRGPHPSGGYTPPALRTWLSWARNAPHNGHFGQDTGRMIGWPAAIIAQSIKRAGAQENKPWAAMLAEFVETATMPNGILSRCDEQNPASVWYDPANSTAHSFEVPILWNGAIGCSTYGVRPIANPQRFAECLYEEAPLFPYYGGVGPPQYAYVAARGGSPYPTVTSGKNAGQPNSGDSSHVHHGCTLAAVVNPADHQRWIDAAQRINPNFSDPRGSAGIVAQVQRA